MSNSNKTDKATKKHVVHLRTNIPVDLAFRVEASADMTDEQLKHAVSCWYGGEVGVQMTATSATKIELEFCAAKMGDVSHPIGWATPVQCFIGKCPLGEETKFFTGWVQLPNMETPQHIRVEEPYAFWNEDAWDDLGYWQVAQDDHWMTHKEYCEVTEEPYEEDYMDGE